MSYVNNFFKEQVHNYEGFFSSYTNPTEVYKIKEELNSLIRQIAEKSSLYSSFLRKRYNNAFTPYEKEYRLEYQNRDGDEFNYDLSGMPISEKEDMAKVILDRKNGSFSILSGYCFDLGAVIVQFYDYSVSGTYKKVNLKLNREVLVPMFENKAYRTILDGAEFSEPTECYPNSAYDAMTSVNATFFIKNFYGIEDKTFNFSLERMRKYYLSNKSFETIIRTCDDTTIMNELLDIDKDKAGPIHEVINVSKQDWEYAKSRGVLLPFIRFCKNVLKTTPSKERNYRNEENKDRLKEIINKTNIEWIDFLEKCEHWKEDLDFYRIAYSNDLATTLIIAYLGKNYPYQWENFSKYYPFGKFCSYVVEETVNQGYTTIRDFISTLTDYLRMVVDLGAPATLYSSYLRQTHDIVSRNHKIKVDEEQEEIFAKRYEGFTPWVDEKKNYTVIAPATTADVQKEGDSLNHCVASYIKRVINDECRIFFLRENKHIETSLVTLELRGDKICQARGKHNRSVSEDERFAIYKFAKAKSYKVSI
jgi:hypothetical protein